MYVDKFFFSSEDIVSREEDLIEEGMLGRIQEKLQVSSSKYFQLFFLSFSHKILATYDEFYVRNK